MAILKDYYEILQVHFLAEPEVIEAAYRKLAAKYHPDRNPNLMAQEKMKEINIAHDVLSDPEPRKRYV
jgi:DnaJ-class molecular chaperone